MFRFAQFVRRNPSLGFLFLAALVPSAPFGQGEARQPVVQPPPRAGLSTRDAQRASVRAQRPPSPPGSVSYVAAQPAHSAPNVNVTQNAEPQNTTTIAAAPDNPMNLVVSSNDYRNGDVQAGVACSFDGGVTWTADTLDAVNPASGIFDAQGVGSVAAGRGGAFHYAFADFDRGGNFDNRLVVATSTDGGVTWPTLVAPITVFGGVPAIGKPDVAVDLTGGAFDGSVYVAWAEFGFFGTEVVLARSRNGGATFSSVKVDDNFQGCQVQVAVGPDGQVYVAWFQNGNLMIDRSTDGGLTFGTDQLVTPITPVSSPLPGAAFRVNQNPSLAVDLSGGPANGNLYLAWADQIGVGQGPDAVIVRSTDGGTSWSGPIRVSKDTNGSYQFFPSLTVNRNGVVSALFLDRRRSPGSTLYDAFLAQSFDGGQTFLRNHRISARMSDAANDGFSGVYVGDYTGIASSGNRVFPCWADCRQLANTAEAYMSPVLSVLSLLHR